MNPTSNVLGRQIFLLSAEVLGQEVRFMSGGCCLKGCGRSCGREKAESRRQLFLVDEAVDFEAKFHNSISEINLKSREKSINQEYLFPLRANCMPITTKKIALIYYNNAL